MTELIILINAFICLFIAIRMFTFSRTDQQYKPLFNWLAWLMICSSAATFIYSFFGLLGGAYLAQSIMNISVLICLLRTKGNIAQLQNQLKPKVKTYDFRQ